MGRPRADRAASPFGPGHVRVVDALPGVLSAEPAGNIVLLVGAVAALAWANSGGAIFSVELPRDAALPPPPLFLDSSPAGAKRATRPSWPRIVDAQAQGCPSPTTPRVGDTSAARDARSSDHPARLRHAAERLRDAAVF